MEARIPITIITGYLGAGKTTLLRRILDQTERKLAILMNEFGEIAIDSKVIKGKNIDMIEMLNGCVCCSLQGEFEEAVKEILSKVKPDAIVVETTGVAEPDAIAFDIQENLKGVRLDGIITIVDADGMIRFPALGYIGKVQIEMADILLLNKVDLTDENQLEEVREKVKRLNPEATIFEAKNCEMDTRLLFGLEIEKVFGKREHSHEEGGHLEGMESFAISTDKKFDRKRFEDFAKELPKEIYRSKGFVIFPDGSYLFNYVAGRFDFERFDADETNLVFIGEGILKYKDELSREIKECEL